MKHDRKPIDDCTTCVMRQDCAASVLHNQSIGSKATIEDICADYRDYKKRLAMFEELIERRGAAFALLRLDTEMQEFFTNVSRILNSLIHVIAFMQSAEKQPGPILDPKEIN